MPLCVLFSRPKDRLSDLSDGVEQTPASHHEKSLSKPHSQIQNGTHVSSKPVVADSSVSHSHPYEISASRLPTLIEEETPEIKPTQTTDPRAMVREEGDGKDHPTEVNTHKRKLFTVYVYSGNISKVAIIYL